MNCIRLPRMLPALLVTAWLFGTAAAGPTAPQRPTPTGPWFEDDEVFVRLVIRTPEQLTAFYLGRGFNQASIDRILETCFITPVIHNKTLPLLWLELDHWAFKRGDTRITRIKRDYWPAQWDAADLPQAHRSTFGWTLMPEARDLRLDEGVGGSVVIPRQDAPFDLIMNFHTRRDRQGRVKTIVFEDVECATDRPAP